MEHRVRSSFYLIWTAAVVLCAAIAFFAVLLVSFTRGVSVETSHTDTAAVTALEAAASAEAAATPIPTPTATPEPASTILAETEDMGEEYLSKIIFLGDSTTYGLAAFEVLPWQQVWVPSNGTFTLSGQSYTQIDCYAEDGSVQALLIPDAAALFQPEYLVITLGLNGVSFMDESSFKTEYTDLVTSIQEASPDTKIICQSVYPVIDSLVSSDISNERINRANGWILDVAEATGTRYLNTHDLLMDGTGNLIADYNTGMNDGIHLNPTGLNAILTSVRTHGYQ